MPFPLSSLGKGIFAINLFLSFLSYLFVSLFSETFPSQFRCLSELKFLSTGDNQMDSESTNVGFVSWCTGFLTGTCAKLLTFKEAIKTAKTLLFLSFFAPSSICSDSPLACLLVLFFSSFFLYTLFQSVAPADVNTINCHLPTGHFFHFRKYKNRS